MNIIDRVLAPTPKFFKVLRNIGLMLTAVSGGILAMPLDLPPIVLSLAGYVAVAGGVLSAVSQITVDAPAPQRLAAPPVLPADIAAPPNPSKGKGRGKKQTLT